MDLGITGRRALVVSLSRGLGRGIAEALAEEVAQVTLTDGDAAALAETAGRISAIGGKVHVYSAGLSREDLAVAMTDATCAVPGGVDILVNNTCGPPPGRAGALTTQTVAPKAQAMVGNVIALTGRLARDGRTQLGAGADLHLFGHGATGLQFGRFPTRCAPRRSGGTRRWLARLPLRVPPATSSSPGVSIPTVSISSMRRQQAPGQEYRRGARTKPCHDSDGRYRSVEEFSAAAFLFSGRTSYVTGAKYRSNVGLVGGL